MRLVAVVVVFVVVVLVVVVVVFVPSLLFVCWSWCGFWHCLLRRCIFLRSVVPLPAWIGRFVV